MESKTIGCLRSYMEQNKYFDKANLVIQEIKGKAANYKTTFSGRFRLFHKGLNIAATTLKIIPLAVKLIAVAIFDIFTVHSRERKLTQKITNQIAEDSKNLTEDELTKVRGDALKLIKDNTLQVGLTEAAIQAAISTYSSSRKQYGPVVFEWVKSVLDTAKVEGRKVVFMARDGIAPYEVAKILKEKDPNYKDVDISLVFLSRSIISTASENKEDKNLVHDYLIQECNMQKNDKCLFVDVGYQGSMISKIKKLTSCLNLNLKFEYLLSHNPNIDGFLEDVKTPLKSIPINEAGNNLATYWLEDTHQSNLESPKKLQRMEKNGKQVVIPDIFVGSEPMTCKKTQPIDFLLKHFGLEAVMDYAKKRVSEEQNPSNENPVAWKHSSEKMRNEFDAFLNKCRAKEHVLFVHHTKGVFIPAVVT